MDLKIFKNKKEFDLGSLKPRSFDISKTWLWSIFIFVIILLLGAFIASKIFLTVYMKDYKLKTEPVNIEKINVDELRRVVEARQNFINQEVVIPKDPS